jgi:phage repressor protein C with HTH and peptisase S24 domain
MSPDAQIWFHALQLSMLGAAHVIDMPRSDRGAREKLKRLGWPHRSVDCKGGKGGMRTEYQPPADVLAQIHAFLDANPDFFGKEKGSRNPQPAVIHKYPTGHSSEPLTTGSGMPSKWKVQESHQPEHALGAPEGFVLVPRYDVAASMGNGAVIHSEQVVDHLAFRAEWVRTELGTSPKNLILISAIGDSMEPSLRAGDLLLIDRSVEAVKQDAIYAISQDGELRIKRIQRLFDGSLIIKSDNPKYRTEELSPSQAEQMRIVGRVVWSGRRM